MTSTHALPALPGLSVSSFTAGLAAGFLSAPLVCLTGAQLPQRALLARPSEQDDATSAQLCRECNATSPAADTGLPSLHLQLSATTGTAAGGLVLAVFSLLLLPLLVLLCRVVCRPVVYERLLSAAERELQSQRAVQSGLPPPFPSCWYRLCEDSAVTAARPCTVPALGRRFTVRRAKGGSVSCADDGGGWWEVTERAGCVFLWYDSRRRSSSWQLPAAPLEPRSCRLVARTAFHVSCHISEIAENGADAAHLDSVHGAFLLPCLTAARHTWQASWTPQPHPRRHLAAVVISSTLALCSRPLPFTTTTSHITQVGPALADIELSTPFGRLLMVETVTPLSSGLQRVDNVVHAERSVPWLLAKALTLAMLAQFERDLPLWEHKRWLRAPVLVREDALIPRYRRWLQLFYEPELDQQRDDQQRAQAAG